MHVVVYEPHESWRQLRMKSVRVRLVRKLAEMIDGVDLSRHAVGERSALSCSLGRRFPFHCRSASTGGNDEMRAIRRTFKGKLGRSAAG
jgi:hypothetical protein